MPKQLPLGLCIAAFLASTTACGAGDGNASPVAADAAAPAAAAPATAPADPSRPFAATQVADLDEPWAIAFLPDGHLLATEKKGKLKLIDVATGKVGEVTGVPEVDYGGQGGFGDVVPHPKFAENGWVYISYAEKGDGDTRGAAIARAKFTPDANGGGALTDLSVIWRQVPKVDGRGHYGHRIAFGPDGKLWIGSSERQKFDPAQDMASNMGKVLRLNDDGTVPADNPFAGKGDVASQVWSLGHRNILGLAFDAEGRLWNQEMGPKGGDELNLVERGANYGYPIVSNGDHYDGREIPDHDTRPEFKAPVITWREVISPAGLLIYSGDLFPEWKGDAFIGGLSSRGIVRIEFDGETAREAARYDMGARIREVEQGPDGALWVIEDERDGSQGRLFKLTPANAG